MEPLDRFFFRVGGLTLITMLRSPPGHFPDKYAPFERNYIILEVEGCFPCTCTLTTILLASSEAPVLADCVKNLLGSNFGAPNSPIATQPPLPQKDRKEGLVLIPAFILQVLNKQKIVVCYNQ